MGRGGADGRHGFPAEAAPLSATLCDVIRRHPRVRRHDERTPALVDSIVFDFDGVIADSEPLHYEAFVTVSRRFGLDFDYEEYERRYIGFDDRDAFRTMLEVAGAAPPDPERLAALTDDKAAAFERRVAAGIEALPGAVALIDDAMSTLPIAIASGATRRDIDLILDRLDLADRFEVIVSADDVVRSKPDPETYRLAVQHLAARHPDRAIEPHGCVAIEDTTAGLASARGAGLHTLGVDPTGSPGGLTGAERTVRCLTEVSVDTLRRWWP